MFFFLSRGLGEEPAIVDACYRDLLHDLTLFG